MAFELEHDWEGNLATPRARVGEKAKTRLLILLCAVWICLGLISHAPWKPDESQSISIVKSMLHGGSLLAPVAVGQRYIENPPLYYLSAAAMAKAVGWAMSTHDAARLATGLWMSITLLMLGMIGREIWGEGVGRQTTFVFLGSIGLIVAAHTLMPEVATLTGSAMSLYGLCLAKRRPLRASVLLGSGIGISFLSTGIADALIPLCTAILLPLLFKEWRTKSHAVFMGLSFTVALPWIAIWLILTWFYNPSLLAAWWESSLASFRYVNHGYFFRVLGWFAWPALPIAIWGLWRYRNDLFSNHKLQLLVVFFAVCMLVLGFSANNRDIYALPLLLPLAAMAGGAIETLRRGAAAALDWFGNILFGVIGFLVWLGWFAMLTGWPPKLAERMQFLSSEITGYFSWLGFSAAAFFTLVWLIIIINAKHSNRAALTHWAVGITMAWSVLISLWLPWIDSARSYEKLMLSLHKALPAQYACITSRNLGDAQQALLEYYTDVRTQPFEIAQRLSCDLYLIQDEKGQEKIEPGPGWKLIWQGKRASDRREFYRLYQALP